MYLAIEKCEGNMEHLIELMKAVQLNNPDWNKMILASIYLNDTKELNSSCTILSIMRQALEGLKFLHENNMVHRDIKPNNILINKLKVIKLSDMGLSKQLHED